MGAARKSAAGPPASRPAGAGGARAPGSPFGSPEQMQMMMKHLPTIISVAKQAPGVVVGFLLTLFYMLGWVGRKGFRESVAPVGGFHILVFFLVRELYPLWRVGRERAAVERQRRSSRKSFANDIAMQYREKLD